MGFLDVKPKIYKPVAEVNLSPQSDETYSHADVKAPRMAGLFIKIFAWVLELRIVGAFVVEILKRNNRVHKLVSFAEVSESPLFTPSHASEEDYEEQQVHNVKHGSSPAERVQEAVYCLSKDAEITAIGDQDSGFRRWTIMDYSRAYISGETTPLSVAKRFLAAVKESSEPHLNMSFFISYDAEDILEQAKESTIRHERGTPISVLDGVLVAVKDEIDCMPYPTTGGTKWFHKVKISTEDAYIVKQLRSCGAILVGKTNMHEIGAGTSGINPHYGAVRNPYNIDKISGGSSSGSAAVVSAGLCPVALGVDGGGSVRIPASLCGVVGFKPTFGRVSHTGILPLNWTVGMAGVLAGTVEDALIIYATISGDLPLRQPSPSLVPATKFPLLASTNSIANIKLAKYGKWFNDSTDEVRSSCEHALDMLCKHYGWTTVEVTLPEIEEMRLAHYVTIASECASSLAPHFAKIDFSNVGWDVRVAHQVYRSFHSKEYLNAQKIRNRQMHFHKEIFKIADVIVTPTTGVTAYPLQRDTLNTGELDYINGAALVRFMIAGNFLGLPAVTIMVGCDKGGMPIGLQFIGRPWSEATLLHLAYGLQAICSKSSKRPMVFYDLLKKEEGTADQWGGNK
ncbi:hypothetical protein J5N97_019975 [Dioscorea zingiberensis]|uniref:Amidase domain-containing protein n=1 Tax=Dioscorea zingiberensis TaxID=325984 RepID=A0A9D5HCT3_9LILI|nr:hypothetical protein J5N97_019975 [Dioscorea zingiberensis]